eukprot:scaffold171354_cov77-Attheya_sp.AAC.4
MNALALVQTSKGNHTIVLQDHAQAIGLPKNWVERKVLAPSVHRSISVNVLYAISTSLEDWISIKDLIPTNSIPDPPPFTYSYSETDKSHTDDSITGTF